jgi:hypothetical protein
MRRSTLDLMTEYAISCLASDDHLKIRNMVQHIAQTWPSEPALAVAFAVTSAASHIDDSFVSESSKKLTHWGYQLAAMVAADVFAIEAMGQAPATGHDLLHFWRRFDPYFLRP